MRTSYLCHSLLHHIRRNRSDAPTLTHSAHTTTTRTHQTHTSNDRLSRETFELDRSLETHNNKTRFPRNTGTRELGPPDALLMRAATIILVCFCEAMTSRSMLRPTDEPSSRANRRADLLHARARLRTPTLGVIPTGQPTLHLIPGSVVHLRAHATGS